MDGAEASACLMSDELPLAVLLSMYVGIRIPHHRESATEVRLGYGHTESAPL